MGKLYLFTSPVTTVYRLFMLSTSDLLTGESNAGLSAGMKLIISSVVILPVILIAVVVVVVCLKKYRALRSGNARFSSCSFIIARRLATQHELLSAK